MSAGVETMFSGSGIKPWHGIGRVLEGTLGADDALVAAGLDWEVEKRMAGAVFPDGSYSLAPKQFLCRSTDNAVLGYVAESYKEYQNRELFTFADAVIAEAGGGKDAQYECAGSLFGGRKVFLLLKLPGVTLAGDAVENYLFLSNSHEGTESLMAGVTNVRVVCNNTLQMAVRNAPRLWRLRHTNSLQARQAEAARSLGLAVDYVSSMEDDANRMLKEKIGRVQEEAFFRQLFAETNAGEERKEKLVTDIKMLYDNKPDLQNFRGTQWGLYNAVADYVSNKPRNDRGEWPGHHAMARFMYGEELLERAEKILKAA